MIAKQFQWLYAYFSGYMNHIYFSCGGTKFKMVAVKLGVYIFQLVDLIVRQPQRCFGDEHVNMKPHRSCEWKHEIQDGSY